MTLSSFHIQIGARTLWQEARGEPAEGQAAVAHVLINRLNSGRWGATMAEVCLSEYHGVYQFSGWMRTDPNRVLAFRLKDDDPLLAKLVATLLNAQTGSDPTGGATHYYAPKAVKATPAWVAGATPCGKFGNQLFFKNVS